MRRIINIIKDRHLGEFDYKIGGKTVTCLRVCDYRVFIEDDFGNIEICSAIDDDYLISGDILDDEEPITPVYVNITKERIERYAIAEVWFDMGEAPADNDVIEDYREMVLDFIRLAPDHPTIWSDVREMLNLPAPKYERIR